jgi:hypothetical protein
MPLVSAKSDSFEDDEVPPKVEREQRTGRPFIHQPDGTVTTYTRASGFGKVLDDETGLTKWRKRMVAIGVAAKEQIRLSVLAHRDEPSVLDELCEQADKAADSDAASTTGTALHKIMDLHDLGRKPYVPEDYQGDIAAYAEATNGLRMVKMEQFVVDDEMEAAGSYDRVWQLRWDAEVRDKKGALLAVIPEGTYVVGDLKTGKSISYGHCSWGVQMSIYAHGTPYDAETNTRVPETLPISQDWGLIIHAPAKKADVQLYWMNVAKGRELAYLSRTIRKERRSKTMLKTDLSPTLEWSIRHADSNDDLKLLWKAASEDGRWRDEHTALAATRKAELAERLF